MRRSLLAVVAGVFLLTSSLMGADELVYARFADYVEALRVQLGIPGMAAAIVGPTDVLWERGFGYQDVARALPMRPDTPVHIDGITEVFTSSILMACTERGQLGLDERVGTYVPDAPEPDATIRQLLSHTSQASAGGLTFLYRPERLDALAEVLRRCEGASYRSASAQLQARLAMVNSVPGADVLDVLPPGSPEEPDTERDHYASVLQRLAVPYAVDSQRRVSQSRYSATTLTPSTGLISTVHDYAQFDLALRSGLLMQPETLAEAWRVPLDVNGKPLPHALGWFVQGYNGDPVIWQFGTSDNGSSSMVITLPARGLSLVLFANSTGLVKSFPLAKGDVTTSPFGRTFLSLFTR